MIRMEHNYTLCSFLSCGDVAFRKMELCINKSERLILDNVRFFHTRSFYFVFFLKLHFSFGIKLCYDDVDRTVPMII